ncbi:MAG: hypothetical protein ACTSV1_00245 [Alphaproteobacteria bacterium]
MAHQTHYEVHVKQNGRWEIHARHPAGEKELAIEEAKSLDSMKHIQTVKVIQEIFDPDEGLSKEYNVYTPGEPRRTPAKRGGAKAPALRAKEKAEAIARGETVEDDEDGEETDNKAGKNKKPHKSRPIASILLRMTGIVVFSLVVGTMFTWFASMLMGDSSIGENAQANILFIIFLVVFVISAIPMAMVFLGKEDDD